MAAGEGRLDVATGTVRHERHDRAGVLEERFGDFAEIVADGYSRRQYRAGEMDVLSRIDRVFMNSLTCDLDAVRASARYVSSVLDTHVPSGPTAIELVLSLLARGLRRTIPRWMLDHPMFHSLCDEVISYLGVDVATPFESIARLADVFHAVARHVRREGRPLDATRARAWLASWLLVARTAHGRGDAGRVRAALARTGDATIASLFVDEAGRIREVLCSRAGPVECSTHHDRHAH